MTIKEIDLLVLSTIKDLSAKQYEAAHVKLARVSLALEALGESLEVAEGIISGARK